MRRRIIPLIGLVAVMLGVSGPLNWIDAGQQKGSVQASSRVVQLTDQQIAVLAGLYIYPDWVDQTVQAGQLVYGNVQPADNVPAGVRGYGYLVADDGGNGPQFFFKVHANRVVTVKYANAGAARLKTKQLRLRQLVKKNYRTARQQKRVNQDVSRLRTE
ncbi:Lreu_0056 family protein [Limosilactobacillus kribbianus]|uniref:Lreu_0056 family protein n=1 Tax=Limosilactobacillus kribbianus TaxID=2982695 RepID=UPI0022653CD1|nr:hypothetical protein [Limosilactobacillus kribbianus]